MLKIDFSPKYLPVLDLFKAKHDIRYYLCGIYVEKAPQGGVYLVGSDGHTMAVIYDRDGSIEGADSAIITIDAGMVSAAKKATNKSARGLSYKVTVRGARARVAVPDSEDLELFIQPGRCIIEGKFPEWRKVVPDFEKLVPGAFSANSFNANYMARMAKVVEPRYAGVSVWHQPGENFGVVMQVQRLPEAFFVLMPMREHGNVSNFKQFAAPVSAPAEAETQKPAEEVPA
jgi:hypothetical protein